MGARTHAIKSVSYLDLALAFMVVVSIAIVAVPQQWLETSLEIDPRDYPVKIFADAHLGGNSEVSWLDQDSQRWQCKLQAASEPFCSMQVDITNEERIGVDLSGFDKMTIWADYFGSATHLRLYLRNRHPNYFRPHIEISTKYNMIEVPVRALATGLELSMSDFTVAEWWLIGGNIPPKYSYPEFNEIALLEVQTGSTDRSGTHEIQLKKISWSGSLIRKSTLQKAVIIGWSVAVFGILLSRLVAAQRELKTQRTTREELMALNASLNLETRRFEQLAKTDPLTGLYNRVGVRDIIYRGLVDWRDKKTPFSFIMIDLDNFKLVNDTYGHDVGDAVLKDATKLMLDQIRHTDALARWGGEEFVLVCPDTSLEQALQVAENLRSTLETQLKCQGNPVTASFGVATMSEAKLDQLFKKADIALYRAKQLGRNRVCTEASDDKGVS